MKIFLFSLDNLQKHRGKTLLMWILFTISFLLVGAVIYFDEYSNYSKNSCDRLLTYGIEQTGVLTAREFADDDLKKIVAELSAIEEMAVMTGIENGNYGFDASQSQIGDRLINQQHKFFKNRRGNTFECIRLNKDGWKLCDLKLVSGLPPDEIQIGQDEYALYLGNHFSEIAIGTELKLNNGKKLVVRGILKEGQMYTSKSLWTATNHIEGSLLLLDPLGIIIKFDKDYPDIFSPIFFFSVDKESNWELVKEKIDAIFEKYNATYTMARLDTVFDRMAVYSKRAMGLLHMLMLVVITSLVVIQTCTQMAEILQNQKEYGIFCANGMNFRQLSGIVFIKSVIAFVLGFFLAVGLGAGILFLARESGRPIDVNWNIVFEYAAVKIMTIQVLTFVAGLIVPLVWLYRLRPAQLIGGEASN